MGAQRFSKAKITANGVFWDTFQGVSINPGGNKRNESTSNFSTGYSEERVPPKIEFERTWSKGDKVADVDFADGTILAECDTGQTFAFTGAFLTEPPDIVEGGKTKLIYLANSCKEY